MSHLNSMVDDNIYSKEENVATFNVRYWTNKKGFKQNQNNEEVTIDR